MISGFNTDVEFDGVVYHVQTEDKGLSARMIMTLIYNRGTILASKRTTYDDLANGNFDKKIVAERLGRQHKLICAAVRAGRMDDLKQMSKKPSPAVVAETPIAASDIAAVPMTIGKIETQRIISVTSPKTIEIVPATVAVDLSPPTIEMPVSVPIIPVIDEMSASLEIDTYEGELIFEDVSIIGDYEIFLDAGAVAVVSELSGTDRPVNEKLSIELLGETKFKGGDRMTVGIMICRGTARKVVGSAQIMIKVLGSTFRPVIFHAKTDANGLANIHLQLPHFRAGRAALLIRAITDGEEIELRRIVTPG